MKASDNAYPSLLITEGTEPSAPAAGHQRLYIDSTTHKLKRTNSSGTDVDIEGTAGTGAFTGCIAQRTTDQTGIVHITQTIVTFDGTDLLDVGGYHDPASNPSRITIPSGKDGVYLFWTDLIWDSASGAGGRQAGFLKNNTSPGGIFGRQGYIAESSGQFTFTSTLAIVSMVATDYMEVQAYHDSGANRTLKGATVALRFGCQLMGT